MPSQGEREAELMRAVSRFHRDAFGRGPVATRAFLLDGLAVVALRGVLTPAEARLAESGDSADAALVRDLRHRLVRAGSEELLGAVRTALGPSVRAVLSDIDPVADGAVFVFVFGPAVWPEQ